MDLKRKLLLSSLGKPQAESRAALSNAPPTRHRDAKANPSRTTQQGLVQHPSLPGALQETPHGPVHVVERLFSPDHVQGRTRLSHALEVDPATIASLALDPRFEHVDPRGMLLVDTETTGLAGGTGTYPFLVGMAWFEDTSLRVQQLFLRQPRDEASLLAHFAERLATASCIVTYNGKSFDWPLLRNRFILSRVRMPPAPPHLDLLHCTRRIYKRRLGSVRLIEVEAHVLGMVREDDIPGAEIPAIYLRWLRAQETDALAAVLAHNECDLISLAALLAHLAQGFDALQQADDPCDRLAYARLAERAGDPVRALSFAHAAAEGGAEAEHTVHAWLLAARVARRRGDADEEEMYLRRALQAADDALAASEVHLRLAKLYEHRRKDFERALTHAAHTAFAEGDEAQAQRRRRLGTRMQRRPPTGPMGRRLTSFV